jgi:broad specificity phosphatase PhoE
VNSRTVLILVRHGETSANTDGVWHGSLDTPLSPRGSQQAARVAGHIATAFPEVTAVYTSNLQRARHTAEAIAAALGLGARIDDALREYHLGSWEGKSFADLYHEENFFHHIKADPNFAPHGGESPREVTDRLTGALRSIAAGHARERVVVVTHGGALSMAMGALLDGSYANWHSVMDNCAISELVFEPAPELLTFNFIEHLADL